MRNLKSRFALLILSLALTGCTKTVYVTQAPQITCQEAKAKADYLDEFVVEDWKESAYGHPNPDEASDEKAFSHAESVLDQACK
jgi:hypothetical protein